MAAASRSVIDKITLRRNQGLYIITRIGVGGLPEQIARRAEVTVVGVRRRGSPPPMYLRQTVLEPRPSAGDGGADG